MDEQNITAGLLLKIMSAISEEYWCAGWLHDLEYILWDAVIGRRKDICTPEEIKQLKYLSEKCGGWIILDTQTRSEIFVPMQQWRRLYEARQAKVSRSGE